jgi:hypothetical protein
MISARMTMLQKQLKIANETIEAQSKELNRLQWSIEILTDKLIKLKELIK